MSSTPSQTIVLLGAPSVGKSTVVGHLLHICDTFSQEQVSEALLESQRAGKGETGKWSFVVDRQQLEREHGHSIHTTYHKLQTRKNLFTVINTPGQSRYLKNCITGIGQGHIGLLVISAVEGEFQDDLAITKQHLTYAFCLGIKNIVVAINKFDDPTVNWSNERYLTLTKQIETEAKTCGFKSVAAILPISALHGDNLTKPSGEMSWYKGFTLQSALDDVSTTTSLVDKPFRMVIQEVKIIKGKTVVIGQVGTGSIKLKSKVLVSPSQIASTVKSIQMYKEEVKSASAGDNVGICLEGVNIEMIQPGSILSSDTDEARPVQSFVAQVQVKSGAPKTIKIGYSAVVDVHSTHVPCKVHRVIHTLNPKTGKPDQINPKSIAPGAIAWVELVPLAPLCLEPYGDYPPFGRLSIRNGTDLIAIGVVKTVAHIGGKQQGTLHVDETKEY